MVIATPESGPSFSEALFGRLFELAAAESDDPRTKNAALVEDKEGRWCCWQTNRLPRGLAPHSPEELELWLQSPTKYDYLGHAEENCCLEAARQGVPLAGGSMWALWAPCPVCARAIIGTGLKRLTTLAPLQRATPARWSAKVLLGLQLCRRVGVEVVLYQPRLGHLQVPRSWRFDGKSWNKILEILAELERCDD